MNMYDIAREVTDNVLGIGTYAQTNAGNPDPRVQAAIRRGERVTAEPGVVRETNVNLKVKISFVDDMDLAEQLVELRDAVIQTGTLVDLQVQRDTDTEPS